MGQVVVGPGNRLPRWLREVAIPATAAWESAVPTLFPFLYDTRCCGPTDSRHGLEPIMRSLLKLLIVLLICLAAIGLYRGWFTLSRPSPDTESNKVNVNVSVDKGKMKSDIKKAEEKIEEEVKELEGDAKPDEAK
jgi:hypothetical protein